MPTQIQSVCSSPNNEHISLNENPDLEPDLTLTTQTVAYLEVPVHEAQRLKSGTSEIRQSPI